MSSQDVLLVEYLFTRLHQLGVTAVNGVPGDYNLVALDYLGAAGLKWIGDANELNAGYAADGYARVKGMGVVITTFGVGELSAINAIAGSYAEYVPVVHIVGSPSTLSQRDGMLLHHTLGNGDFKVFSAMYKSVTVAQADLNDPISAPEDIDRVLKECWLKSRPVYIQLPTDMVQKKVVGTALKTKIDSSYPGNIKEVEADVVSKVLKELYAAKRPCILVDGCVLRHKVVPEVSRLVKTSQLPTFVSPMGKGAIDETWSNFGGVYAGDGSYDSVREYIEKSDLVLSIGALKSDFNTTGFTYRISQLSSVDFHSEFVNIGYAKYEGVRMRGVIEALSASLEPKKLRFEPFKQDTIRTIPGELKANFRSDAITQEYLWPRLSSFLKPKDILLTETGTSYLGIWDTRFPSNITAISQTLWGSIGYTLPAAQGAAIAAKEMGGGRVILFEGDGSFQLTVQAIGTMIHHKLDIIIFLINNSGYTIERWVHGMEAPYNDVPKWRYADVPEALGGSKATAKSYKVNTRAEFEGLLRNEEFWDGKGMQFVEMRMPRLDAPESLKMVCAAAAKTNAETSE